MQLQKPPSPGRNHLDGASRQHSAPPGAVRRWEGAQSGHAWAYYGHARLTTPDHGFLMDHHGFGETLGMPCPRPSSSSSNPLQLADPHSPCLQGWSKSPGIPGWPVEVLLGGHGEGKCCGKGYFPLINLGVAAGRSTMAGNHVSASKWRKPYRTPGQNNQISLTENSAGSTRSSQRQL